MRVWLPRYVAILFVIASTRQLSADVTPPIVTSKDATIFANSLTNSNGAGPGMFAGTDGSGKPLRSLIQFDIAGNVPAGSTINSVQLTLYLGMVVGNGMGGSDSTHRTIELHRLLASWGEGTTESGATGIGSTGSGAPANDGDATWLDRFYSATTPTAWTTAGGDFIATASGSTLVTETLNSGYSWLSTPALISDVQGWLNSPSSNNGWLLENTDETNARTFRAFWTREATNSALRPQLQINFTQVPEPTALLPASVLALMTTRRRRT